MKTRTTALLLLAGLASSAHASPTAELTVDDTEESKADKPQRRRHLRMALELTTILAVGNRWYWRDNGKPNEVDWQLEHDMNAVKTKMGAGGWRFDGNPFDINALGHPGFGGLTHYLARQNGYSIGETFLISNVVSGTWEVFIELAEYGSINDALSTAPAGIPIGEAAYQIVNNWRETTYEVRGGVGAENGSSFGVVSTRGELDRIPRTGDGTVMGGRKVGYAVAMTSDTAGVRSIDGSTEATLVGYYQNGANHSLHLGINTAFLYRNVKDRPDRAWDLMSKVTAGPTLDLELRRGDATVTVGADLSLDFAMLKSQAYETWRADHMTDKVRNVMQDKAQPYYYAMGATLDPRINVNYHGVNVGGTVAASLFGSIDGADRDQEMMTADTHMTDHDARAQAWVGYEYGNMSLVLDAALTSRGGSMGDARQQTTGQTAMLTVGYRR
ncbi:MAG: DUF3943 domain-containing protein [Deltaproteobacteria bacterium]|nr:DUF3943 domain-containing protein [Deltaproteobacteria bacterium]